MTELRPRVAADRPDLAAARNALRLAADGIRLIADELDGAFVNALDAIEDASGRVIVTGMGKSGHVGRKIAATLASTGSPAFFVHPAEASHGDLGMIARGDVVLALSNSGETAELSDIVSYARRFGIPLIAMTRMAASSLGDAADVVLTIPAAPEACPIGLAPTTSTSMMLALGDALAMALLERRGFTRENFHLFHPGGALGKRLRHVFELMHRGSAMPLVGQTALTAEALLVMSEKRFGCVGVVDDSGRLVGIFTDGDLRRHMSVELPNLPVTEMMTANPVTIRPDALAAEALGVMNERAILALFVVENGQPVGIIHIHDCLRIGADQTAG